MLQLAHMIFLMTVITTQSFGQAVAINAGGDPPNAKSILDVSSIEKGLLIPRMTTAKRENIGPGITEAGMMVYDTDLARFMFFNGADWLRLGDGFWRESGAGIQNEVANVGIGGAPTAGLPLSVSGGMSLAANIFNSGAGDAFGLKVTNTVGTGIAVFSGSAISGYPSPPAAIFGIGSDGANGAFFSSLTAGGTGVLALSGGTGPAIDAFALGTGFAGLFRGGDVSIEERLGIGTSGPVSNRLRVEGSDLNALISGQSNFVGNFDVRAVEGISVPAPGWGYGGEFTGGYVGVYGFANGTSYAGDAIGVYGISTGSTGLRIGVYGTAIGGATNWAGYFNAGNVFMANDLRLGDIDGAVGYKLSVQGKIICEELKVQSSATWPDYVFSHDYNLMPIRDLEQHIIKHHHLPGIPSAEQVAEEGILIGDMQTRMMEKIEELTLYIIAQDKRIAELEKLPESGKQ